MEDQHRPNVVVIEVNELKNLLFICPWKLMFCDFFLVYFLSGYFPIIQEAVTMIVVDGKLTFKLNARQNFNIYVAFIFSSRSRDRGGRGERRKSRSRSGGDRRKSRSYSRSKSKSRSRSDSKSSRGKESHSRSPEVRRSRTHSRD